VPPGKRTHLKARAKQCQPLAHFASYSSKVTSGFVQLCTICFKGFFAKTQGHFRYLSFNVHHFQYERTKVRSRCLSHVYKAVHPLNENKNKQNNSEFSHSSYSERRFPNLVGGTPMLLMFLYILIPLSPSKNWHLLDTVYNEVMKLLSSLT
jgi:hypothetical protein